MATGLGGRRRRRGAHRAALDRALEYLFIDYGNNNTTFFGGAQPINSDFPLQEVRAGVNYQFDNDAPVRRRLW